MRTKLLMTAALAMALPLSFAAADTTPIDKPDKTPLKFSIDPDKPDLPVIDKPLPTDALFGDDPQSQTANIEQTMTDLDGLLNDASIKQNGAQNQAQISQEGNDNVASVTQSDINAPSNFNVATNLGVIDQTGDGNRSTVVQVDTIDGGPSNIASVHQFCDEYPGAISNEANVKQVYTNGAVALVVQGASDAGTTNNYANVYQEGYSTSDRLDTRIDQQLDGNTANVAQFGVGDYDGNGSGGIVRIQQTGIDEASVGDANDATVIQGPGADLTVNILQSSEEPPALGVDGANTALVDQLGYGSTTNIEQRNDGNTAKVTQWADNGDVHILQNDLDSVGTNFVDVFQGGDGNALILEQRSADNTAFVDQSGYNNTILVDQDIDFGTGPEGDNFVDLTQDYGTSNSRIEVEQDHFFTDDNTNSIFVDQIYVADSVVQVAQVGEGNSADITQAYGGSLTAKLIQGGPGSFRAVDNTATIYQTGWDNTVLVLQDDDRNTADVYQEGSGNLISLEQNDSNWADIDQGGHGNTIHVFQLGQYDEATVEQFSDNSVANVVQRGGGNVAYVSQNPAY